jgi:decaprenylphospho-beta-D-ribofuranose 2-oxidase
LADRRLRGRDHCGVPLSAPRRERLSGWGRFPIAESHVERPRDAATVSRLLETPGTAIARGNGRSYGDSSLNPDLTIDLRGMDRMIAFDADTGILTCEAGAMLAEIIDLFLKRGWFPPVTPGTRFVTIGGMIASDVHGKNHGAGSFGDHLEWIDLAVGPGEVLRCSPHENAELFAATCGGMGLTGVILRAAFRMLRVETAMMRQRTVHAKSLDESLDLLSRNGNGTYSVAWIDCVSTGSSLGRSVVTLAEHATVEDLPAAARSDPFRRPTPRPKRVPIDFPHFALNRLSVRLFNGAYYRAQFAGEALARLDGYFYPLDGILEWNRIYGRRGFAQYQCVLPVEESAVGMQRLLKEISAAGDASFLTVLKLMGHQSFGLLSFPRPGFTLALDFAVKPETLALMDRLDAITAEHGGRLYLTKDSRMSRDMLERGYPRLDDLRRVRREYGLDARFQSLQSQRLEL